MLPGEQNEMVEYDERSQSSSPLELRRTPIASRGTPGPHNMQATQDRSAGKCPHKLTMFNFTTKTSSTSINVLKLYIQYSQLHFIYPSIQNRHN